MDTIRGLEQPLTGAAHLEVRRDPTFISGALSNTDCRSDRGKVMRDMLAQFGIEDGTSHLMSLVATFIVDSMWVRGKGTHAFFACFGKNNGPSSGISCSTRICTALCDDAGKWGKANGMHAMLACFGTKDGTSSATSSSDISDSSL